LIGCKNILGLKLHYTFLVPATEWIFTENDRRGMDDQYDNNRLSKINHSSLFRQLENKLQPAGYQRKHFLRQGGENCWNQVYDEGKFTLLCLLIATTLLWLCTVKNGSIFEEIGREDNGCRYPFGKINFGLPCLFPTNESLIIFLYFPSNFAQLFKQNFGFYVLSTFSFYFPWKFYNTYYSTSFPKNIIPRFIMNRGSLAKRFFTEPYGKLSLCTKIEGGVFVLTFPASITS
jgi:hypothetical protein